MGNDLVDTDLLIKKREDIEAEIKELNEVLDSQQSIGMEGALVDTDGFPRADIDVYSVRHARQRIICLQNDYTDVMKDIEEELYEIHAKAREQLGENMETGHQNSSVAMETERLPIGTVQTVDEGSPADRAGLKTGDSILQFGSLQHENFQGLQNIASVVQHSVNSPVPVIVRRQTAVHKLTLIPARWKPDKGLLGCQIQPIVQKKS